MRLSIIVPFLNSHEIVRRQLLWLSALGVGDMPEVEVLFMDDGSDPPLRKNGLGPDNLRIIPTHDTRPWTSSLARNLAAKEAEGEYLFMVDGDYILTSEALESGLTFNGDRLGVRRKLAVLDGEGRFREDHGELVRWGADPERLERKGNMLPPHPNQFLIRRSVFLDLGGYSEELVLSRPYPHGEDNDFKSKWKRALSEGRFVQPDDDLRPTIGMFPNGQFAGDADANPFGLFHTLSRKGTKS